ncbi:MAG: LacI family transcriptional regulator [Actinobacteria bacterium]|nr:LacI family transcriptional regulator [Actinomycetota bacterium]
MVSSLDVARLAGVSRSQVSNYFNRPDLVSEDMGRRIGKAVEQLGYTPNETARRLRRGHNENIGVVLVDAWGPFFDEVSVGIEDEAEASGWSVQFSNSRRSAERERRHIEFYEAQMTQGVIVFPTGDVSEIVRRLARRGITAVLLDPPHATRLVPPVPSVAVDHIIGGGLAGQHLVARGARRPAFVGDPAHEHTADRIEGFQQAVREGLPRSRPSLFPTDTLSIPGGALAAQQILALPADERPDGLFAANDLVAIGLMQALTAAGIGVPSDIMLIGYDDIVMASQIATPLTTVRQPATELGAAAVRLVVQHSTKRGTSQEHIVLQPELIVRST